MARRGRPVNALRQAARDAGAKSYIDAGNPCWCGSDIKYTVNAACVDCTISKAMSSYQALDADALARRKAMDHDAYVARRRAAGLPTAADEGAEASELTDPE